MSPIIPGIHILLAVALAALGSFGLAAGTALQHRSARGHTAALPDPSAAPDSSSTPDSSSAGHLSAPQLAALLRDRHWLSGMVAIGGGSLFNLAALWLAPVTVVQPVGVLALVWSVLLAARLERARPAPATWRAVAVTILGLATFTALSTRTASAAAAPDLPRAGLAATAAGLLGLGLAAGHRLAGRRHHGHQALVLATSGAVLYGLTASLMKLTATLLATGRPIASAPVLLAATGAAAAAITGCLIVQQAYAAGRAELVVAALTAIDPVVAVGFGMVALGEGAHTGPAALAGMVACGAMAASGVAALSRIQARPHIPTDPRHLMTAPLPRIPRVAVVSDYSLNHLGGAENAYAQQVRALASATAVLAVNPPSPRLEALGAIPGVTRMAIAPAFTLPGLGLPVIRNTAALRARLREAFTAHRVGAVHVHSEFGLAAAAVQVARELGIPTVATVHTFFWQTRAPQWLLATAVPRLHRLVTGLAPSREALSPRPGDSALRNMTLTVARRAERVVSPSAHQADALRRAGLARVDVVPNAAPANPDAEPLTRVDGPLRVLWIGRFAPEKRVLPFIEAALRALDAVGPQNLRVDLIGTGPQFCRAARMIGERPGIQLDGALPNDLVPTELRRAHLTALSSVGWDNQPMTVAESVTALRGVLWCDPALTEGLAATGGLPGAGIPARAGRTGADRTGSDRTDPSLPGAVPPDAAPPDSTLLDSTLPDPDISALATTLIDLALAPEPVIDASRRAVEARRLFSAEHFTAAVLNVYHRAADDARPGAPTPRADPTPPTDPAPHTTSTAIELENAS